MSGRSNIPDNSPDGLAYVWAYCEEQRQADQLFEALVRAVEAELLTSARAMAYRILRDSNDVDDAVDTAWVKIWEKRKDTTRSGTAAPSAMAEQTEDEGRLGQQSSGFDPDRGPFTRYFFRAVRNACYDICRRRQTAPLPFADVSVYEDPMRGALTPEAEGPEEEILKKIESIKDRITAAIEVLGLSDQHRDMLRLMLDPEETGPPADSRAAAAARQRKKRLREKVARLAGLTPDEQEAVSVMREHHPGATAPGVEVQRLFASAKRKVAALFGIETEGLT